MADIHGKRTASAGDGGPGLANVVVHGLTRRSYLVLDTFSNGHDPPCQHPVSPITSVSTNGYIQRDFIEVSPVDTQVSP